MDPNATLTELRELVAFDDPAAVAEEMAERIEALDAWLTNGGFLPDEWQHKA
jgi:hypothetical protein